MLCYDPYSVAQANYERRYRITWTLDPVSVERAYRIYLVGLLEKLGIVETVTAVYGYRARRPENFLKEIRFWDERTKKWIANNVLVKVYTSYRSRREAVSVEGELTFALPIGEFYLNEDYIVDVFYSAVERSIPIYTLGVNVGVTCLDITYVDPEDLTCDITLLYTIERKYYVRDYTYRYTFKYDMRDVIRV